MILDRSNFTVKQKVIIIRKIIQYNNNNNNNNNNNINSTQWLGFIH